MTKVYKINELSDYSGGDNLTSVFLKVNEIIKVVNSLALSDKEEVTKTMPTVDGGETWEEYKPKECTLPRLDYSKPCECSNCRPKQEECKHDWIPYHLNKENVDIKYEYCKTCKATRIPELKQPISLKEGITEIVSHSISVHTMTDSVLKLIQSRLVKEIENECQVYACSRKCGGISPRCILDTDIIKIINNIK